MGPEDVAVRRRPGKPLYQLLILSEAFLCFKVGIFLSTPKSAFKFLKTLLRSSALLLPFDVLCQAELMKPQGDSGFPKVTPES